MSWTSPCPICGYISELYFGTWYRCGHQDAEHAASQEDEDDE